MAKPNYRHMKKQREVAKKKEQQERLAKRHGTRSSDTAPKDPP